MPWSVVTASSMLSTCAAVDALTTRVCVGAAAGLIDPSDCMKPLTKLGSTRTPPSAIVEYTVAT